MTALLLVITTTGRNATIKLQVVAKLRGGVTASIGEEGAIATDVFDLDIKSQSLNFF